MHSFDNPLDFHAKFITVPAVGIIKDTKVVNILNNFVIHHSQSNS